MLNLLKKVEAVANITLPEDLEEELEDSEEEEEETKASSSIIHILILCIFR